MIDRFKQRKLARYRNWMESMPNEMQDFFFTWGYMSPSAAKAEKREKPVLPLQKASSLQLVSSFIFRRKKRIFTKQSSLL